MKVARKFDLPASAIAVVAAAGCLKLVEWSIIEAAWAAVSVASYLVGTACGCLCIWHERTAKRLESVIIFALLSLSWLYVSILRIIT